MILKPLKLLIDYLFDTDILMYMHTNFLKTVLNKHSIPIAECSIVVINVEIPKIICMTEIYFSTLRGHLVFYFYLFLSNLNKLYTRYTIGWFDTYLYRLNSIYHKVIHTLSFVYVSVLNTHQIPHTWFLRSSLISESLYNLVNVSSSFSNIR